MSGIYVRTLLIGSLAAALGACSKSKTEAPPFVFYGECTVRVISKTSGADVQIDGISLGEVNDIQVQIPCGEKLIHLKKDGYRPYRQFLRTSLDQPLKVEVGLERYESRPDFALSKEILSQAERGLKPRDPWALDANGKPQGDYPKDMQGEIRVAKATSKSSSGAAAATGGGGALIDDSVENWR